LTKTLLQQKQPSIKQELPVKKKALLTIAFVSMLLFSAVAGIQLVGLGEANPYVYENPYYYTDDISLKSYVNPPMISMSSPKNNTLYNKDNVFLTFNATIKNSTTATSLIYRVYFKTDWLENETEVYRYEFPSYLESIYPFIFGNATKQEPITSFYPNLKLTEIPEGKHNITVYVVGYYYRYPDALKITGCSTIYFAVDTTSPIINCLSLENKTFATSQVQLSFTTSESVSKISYSLDGQDNVTIDGNTTLTGLSDGGHNVTVYAMDEAGNMGASETVYFSVEVPEPFPIALVTIVSVASLSVVGIGLLVYFKKRKH
jgi:hypothetical protein